MKIYLIGAGGVASYLMPVLVRSIDRITDDIVIMDGDRLEERNLDRQLFHYDQIGLFKAQALADLYGVKSICSYLTERTRIDDADWLFVLVDNHKARRLALAEADRIPGMQVIIGANEYTDAEAYYYYPAWAGTPADPRIKYPEILTDNTNDPVACQGDELVNSPQLAISNMLVAAYCMHLFFFFQKPFTSSVNAGHWPTHHSSNFAKIQTFNGLDL